MLKYEKSISSLSFVLFDERSQQKIYAINNLVDKAINKMESHLEAGVLNQIKIIPNSEKLLKSFYQIVSDLDIDAINQHINDLSQKCPKYYSNINFSNENIRNLKIFANSIQNVVDECLKQYSNKENLNLRTSKWTILGISLKIRSNLRLFQNGSSIQMLITNFETIYQLIRLIRDKLLNSNIQSDEYLVNLAVLNDLFQNFEIIFVNSLLIIDSNETKLKVLNDNLNCCITILKNFNNFHQLYQIIFFKNFILPKMHLKIAEIIKNFQDFFLDVNFLTKLKDVFNKLLVLLHHNNK